MIIYNARVITWEDENRVLDNHAVLIRGKLIKDLGPSDEMVKKYVPITEAMLPQE